MGKKKGRIRNSLDVEAEQLDYLRTDFRSELCALIPEDDEVEAILAVVLNELGWEDHSGKDAPPPDFINSAHALMLEAMRVDDHERPGDKKGVINPARAHETEIIKRYGKELKELLNMAADDAMLTVLGKTDLPTSEDHSYSMYLDGFKRIVEKHAKHTENYRHNYPEYKLIFYVFDESTGYFEGMEPIRGGVHKGDSLRGRPHYFFADAMFLDIIRNSNADYFIWHTPFKHEHLFTNGFVLPESVIYDVSRMKVPELHYDRNRMVSMEV
ncbi:hypothetical protein [Olsenella profusa]|uniref:Uncharacterized protein n=1 Tax=Olsenella profusa F0195 TaxID=1125712 RepID=U2V0R6_9ACTN|nr:hypothetical protein [Olsenella profusa]ERL06271.1 hypothetical protein HMPREF1316_2624 [Olsenella profusa F0195]